MLFIFIKEITQEVHQHMPGRFPIQVNHAILVKICLITGSRKDKSDNLINSLICTHF